MAKWYSNDAILDWLNESYCSLVNSYWVKKDLFIKLTIKEKLDIINDIVNYANNGIAHLYDVKDKWMIINFTLNWFKDQIDINHFEILKSKLV